MNTANQSASNRAVAALGSLLSQVSAIRVKNMDAGTAASGAIDILACVEIFGRNHTVACQISAGSDAENVRNTLAELHSHIAKLPGEVTPVLIVPVLSPEVQSLCSQQRAGCLDLRGNGRLSIGEVFVSMRSLPRPVYHRPAAQIRTAAGEGMIAQPLPRGFPALPAHVSQRGAQTVSRTRPL
jgi:hypothetical protein